MKPTKKEVELITLKRFLSNKKIDFRYELLDYTHGEPADVCYDNVDYQITLGDKELVQEIRSTSAKEEIFSIIRDVSNLPELLLRGVLIKKINSSDPNTVLLIEVDSKGAGDWGQLELSVKAWVILNSELLGRWKSIYLVYIDKNIKL